MGQVGAAFIRIRLDKSSGELLDAISDLIEAVDDAAYVPDEVQDASDRLKAALTRPDGISFGLND